MKHYTRVRQFYAWVGFATIVILVLGILAFALVRFIFPAHQKPLIAPDQMMAAVVTAYTSLADETDSTPFVNAAGARPHIGSIACPAQYSFGTIVVIKGVQYSCDDRMAARLQDQPHFDIWLPTKQDAVQFGKQLAIVTIKP